MVGTDAVLQCAGHESELGLRSALQEQACMHGCLALPRAAQQPGALRIGSGPGAARVSCHTHEVDQAVDRILRHTDQLILLQCTSAYPSEFVDINLRVMETFRTRYDVLVGYSGHERGIAVTAAAATLGACVVERHFTKDRTLPGPDHAASLEPIGLEKLVRDIRHIELAMGSSEKSVAPAEVPVRARLGKSVVASRPIAAGTIIRAEMLTAKSPGDGIPANLIERVIGRVAAVDIAADTLLPRQALEWQHDSLQERAGIGSSA